MRPLARRRAGMRPLARRRAGVFQARDAMSGKPAVPPLLRDSTLYFIGNLVSRAVSLAMIRFYSFHLTTAEYGVLNLIELLGSVVAIVFGLQSIGQTMARVYHDQAEGPARAEVVSSVLIGTVLFSAGVMLAAAVAAPALAALIALPDQVGLLRAGFLATVFGTIAEVVLAYHRMLSRARLFLIYSLVSLAATVGLNVWFLGVLHFGVWGFVSSKLIVTGLGSLVLLAGAFAEVGVRVRRQHLAALVAFGLPLVLSSVSYFTIHFSDRIFLARVSPAQVGIYSFAYNFAFLLSILVGDSFGKSWNVTFYAYAGASGWQDRFTRIGVWLVLVLGAGAAGICLFGRDTLALVVNRDFVPPAMMLPILVIGYFFREIGDFFRNVLLIDIGSALVGRIALASAALNLGLNALLIAGPAGLGIWGAAIATLLTWVAYCGLCWWFAARTHGVRFPLPRLLGLGAVVLAVQIAHDRLPTGSGLAQLALDGGWFALVLGLAFAIYLDGAQRRELVAAGRRAAGRLVRAG